VGYTFRSVERGDQDCTLADADLS